MFVSEGTLQPLIVTIYGALCSGLQNTMTASKGDAGLHGKIALPRLYQFF